MNLSKNLAVPASVSARHYSHYDFDINPPYDQDARGKGTQASNDNRCPCCDNSRWCFILDDGNAVICGRTDTVPDGWEQVGTAKDQRPIYAKVGRQNYQRYKGILPSPSNLRLKVHPKTDISSVGRDWQRAHG